MLDPSRTERSWRARARDQLIELGARDHVSKRAPGPRCDHREPTVLEIAAQLREQVGRGDVDAGDRRGIERHGLGAARSRLLVTLSVSAIEGAIAISRAQRSIDPLRRTAAELELTPGEVIGS